jgi:hypothetical protein
MQHVVPFFSGQIRYDVYLPCPFHKSQSKVFKKSQILIMQTPFISLFARDADTILCCHNLVPQKESPKALITGILTIPLNEKNYNILSFPKYKNQFLSLMTSE